MTPTELALIAGLVITIGSTIIVPLYIRRQSVKQITADREAKTIAEAANKDLLSWKAINHVIVTERNRLSDELKELGEKHEKNLAEIKTEFNAEVNRIKAETSYDLDRANERIKQLGEELNRLYRKLVEKEHDGA